MRALIKIMTMKIIVIVIKTYLFIKKSSSCYEKVSKSMRNMNKKSIYELDWNANDTPRCSQPFKRLSLTNPKGIAEKNICDKLFAVIAEETNRYYHHHFNTNKSCVVVSLVSTQSPICLSILPWFSSVFLCCATYFILLALNTLMFANQWHS